MFKQIAVAAALVIASSAALAQQPATKFYVGADVTSTKIDDLDGHETGYGGFVGYKFSPNIAVEAGFRRLADAKYSEFDDYTDVEYKEHAKVDQTSISVIGTLPLSSGFAIYGRLGYNHLKAKYTESASYGNRSVSSSESLSDDKALYGIGLTYDFTPAIAGRVEVQKPDSDVTTVTAGVSFSF